MLMLTESDVREALPSIDAVEIVREGFRLHAQRRTELPAEACMRWTTRAGASARCLVLPARLEATKPRQGVKIINASSTNRRRGYPRASGVACLFDDETARICCIASAGLLSALRTACVSALAIELLAAVGARRLCVLGAGVLARAHVELLLPRLNGLEEVALFDLDARLARGLGELVGALAPSVRCTVTACARDAVCEAQMILAVTTATRGYVRWQWLSAGALVVNVSLDDLTDEVFTRADLLVVDDWGLVASDRTRMLGRLIEQGVVRVPSGEGAQAGRVDCELGDLVIGAAVGRRDRDEIVLFNPFGCGISDVALLAAVYEVAMRHELGKRMPLE